MLRFLMSALAMLFAGAVLAAPPPAPDVDTLVARNSYAMSMVEGRVSGPGADFLTTETAKAQFFLFGEGHDDLQTPQIADAIFALLNKAHGFQYLAVEQDPVAMERVSNPPLRGDISKIAALSKAYPTLFEFTSDQDLTLLAEVGRISAARNPIWGLEQSLGPALYLEMLLPLAPNPGATAATQALLAEAHRKEVVRKDYPKFLHDDPTTSNRLEALRQSFHAAPGSNAAVLLDGLVKSAEIFGYDRRASNEWVGLFNNTEREANFKANFMRDYRAASADGGMPKVMFKFGGWHMYNGRSPGGAYTISNFVHEFAPWNGMTTFGVTVIPGGSEWAKLPASIRVLLPLVRPKTATVIDLRPLRRMPRTYRETLEVKDKIAALDLINAFDAIIVLPEGPDATWTLTGFAPL